MTERYVVGIDEAGRGPVLGPMVYGACYCKYKDKDAIAEMGFMDSKVLRADVREQLFEKIKQNDRIGYAIDVLSPEILSGEMLAIHQTNLNTLSHQSAIGLIRTILERGVHVTHVFVDTVGDETKYADKLSALFPSMSITVTKKADSRFPIVSAASICAKVTRDHAVEHWDFKETDVLITREFGCGYPGDAKTKQWMADHLDPVFGFPSFVRFSWSTSKRMIEAEGTNVVWEEDETEGEGHGVWKQHGSAFLKSRKLNAVIQL